MPRWLLVSVIVVAAVGLLGLGFFLGQGLLPDAETLTGQGAVDEDDVDERERIERAPVPDLEMFTDDETGISMGVPADWERMVSPDPEVRLLATPNFRDSVLIRVSSLSDEEDHANLAELRELTREIVSTAPGVEVLAGPSEFEHEGFTGFHYLYTFLDAESGERGMHSHYFVFRDDAVVAVVFQALPDDRFTELATTFDAMVSSLVLGRTP